jgi:hypothetical protein
MAKERWLGVDGDNLKGSSSTAGDGISLYTDTTLCYLDSGVGSCPT